MTRPPRGGKQYEQSKATRSAGATAKPGGATEATPESEKSVDLLDPAAFWESGDLARGGQAAVPEPEKDPAEEEESGEAVVVSAPVGRTNELFLPESKRIVVTPKPTSGIKSSPAPPVPQEDQKLEHRRPARLAVAGVATGLCLLVGILVWSLYGGGGRAATDASIAGPVPAGGDQADQNRSKENTVVEKKAPDSPPSSDTQTASLKLNSNPPGALVYIDDEKRGVTPLTVKDAAVGTQVSIRIELEGHRPWTQTVVLDGSRQVREFTAGLRKEEICEFGTGWIYVTTVPEGATVEMDGKRLPGKTPMIINDICAGVKHDVHVQAGGFRTWRKVLSIRPQKVLNLDVELER